MSKSLTREAFAEQLTVLRPHLVAYARRRIAMYEDAQDLVEETVMIALTTLACYSDTGVPDALLRWLYGILANRIRIYRARPERRETRMPSSSAPEVEWTALHSEPDSALIHAELRHEARYRARFADLTPRQRACLAARLRGETILSIARRLGLSPPTVCVHLQNAVARLRACPFRSESDPAIADYLFRIGKQVTVYRPPQKTGAALARARLRSLE